MKTIEQRLNSIEKNMVTKRYLRDEQKRFATKEELKDNVDRLVVAIQKNGRDIQEIKAHMATKDDMRIVIDTIDGFVKRVNVQENRSWSNLHRIEILEEKVGIARGDQPG